MITIMSSCSPVAMRYSLQEQAWVKVPKPDVTRTTRSACGVELVPGVPCKITLSEFIHALAGLEQAYDAVCLAALDEATELPARLRSYRKLVNQHTYHPPLVSVEQGDTLPIPFLRHKGLEKCLLYDGSQWGVVPFDRSITPYILCGQCFGWDILYSGDMNLSAIDTPVPIARSMARLLEAIAPINTDARLYTYGMRYGTFCSYRVPYTIVAVIDGISEPLHYDPDQGLWTSRMPESLLQFDKGETLTVRGYELKEMLSLLPCTSSLDCTDDNFEIEAWSLETMLEKSITSSPAVGFTVWRNVMCS